MAKPAPYDLYNIRQSALQTALVLQPEGKMDLHTLIEEAKIIEAWLLEPFADAPPSDPVN